MTDIQDTIMKYLTCDQYTDRHDPRRMRCFVGMIETGEATIEDFRVVGGDQLADEVRGEMMATVRQAILMRRIGSLPAFRAFGVSDVGEAILEDGDQVTMTWGRNLSEVTVSGHGNTTRRFVRTTYQHHEVELTECDAIRVRGCLVPEEGRWVRVDTPHTKGGDDK